MTGLAGEATASPSGPLCDQPTKTNALLQFDEVDAVEQLTPTHGGGSRPLLQWEAVQDAARYSVTLFAPAGHAYWTWVGGESQIYVAGLSEQPDPEGEGPIVVECMTWTVTAYDDSGEVIGAGGPKLLSP